MWKLILDLGSSNGLRVCTCVKVLGHFRCLLKKNYPNKNARGSLCHISLLACVCVRAHMQLKNGWDIKADLHGVLSSTGMPQGAVRAQKTQAGD